MPFCRVKQQSFYRFFPFILSFSLFSPRAALGQNNGSEEFSKPFQAYNSPEK